jgi:hypothetical protein
MIGRSSTKELARFRSENQKKQVSRRQNVSWALMAYREHVRSKGSVVAKKDSYQTHENNLNGRYPE